MLLTRRGSADDAPGAGDASSVAAPNGGTGQPPAAGATGGDGAPPSPPAGRACSKCSQPLEEMQDWCLNCGAGAPGSLGGGPGWRTAAAILIATVLLVGGASVAAYAALEKKDHEPTVAAVAPTTTAPATGLPGTGTTTPGTGTTPIPGVPTTGAATPPKIPLQTPTPKSSGGVANEANEANEALFPSAGTKEASKVKSSNPTKEAGESNEAGAEGNESAPSEEGSGSGSKSGSGKEAPSPILLDTDAASTYNPYAYPAALFGDPSLAIDGEAKTAWTAQVQATSAPKMAEGLLLDLKAPQKLSSASIKTATTGITVEVYATNGHTLPESITDPAWKRLVGLKVLKKKTTSFPLKTHGKAFRYVVLWLAAGQPTSTAADPGSVSIDEFELFPASS
jgi:hypothetical protein